ncbi:hypothetical protein PUN28_015680 [Cardiocondyla obscurior]|uniref:Uncharacterized protein n=1 Tax=Cardiocondyla obscurior TaxID=286306 RepID=A0AAW2EXG2_9HYME
MLLDVSRPVPFAASREFLASFTLLRVDRGITSDLALHRSQILASRSRKTRRKYKYSRGGCDVSRSSQNEGRRECFKIIQPEHCHRKKEGRKEGKIERKKERKKEGRTEG